MLEALGNGPQVAIAILGQEIEGSDHAADLLAQEVDAGIEIAGVEDVIAGEFFFHVRHGFQGLVVVIQEVAEMGKFILQEDFFVHFFFQESPQEFEDHGS